MQDSPPFGSKRLEKRERGGGGGGGKLKDQNLCGSQAASCLPGMPDTIAAEILLRVYYTGKGGGGGCMCVV